MPYHRAAFFRFLTSPFLDDPMPKSIHGKKLTAKDHRQWRHIYEKTHSGAQATGVVKKSMARRAKKAKG